MSLFCFSTLELIFSDTISLAVTEQIICVHAPLWVVVEMSRFSFILLFFERNVVSQRNCIYFRGQIKHSGSRYCTKLYISCVWTYWKYIFACAFKDTWNLRVGCPKGLQSQKIKLGRQAIKKGKLWIWSLQSSPFFLQYSGKHKSQRWRNVHSDGLPTSSQL